MLITNASIRRFISHQKRIATDVPPKIWDKYVIYVQCVANEPQRPKTFKEWLQD